MSDEEQQEEQEDLVAPSFEEQIKFLRKARKAGTTRFQKTTEYNVSRKLRREGSEDIFDQVVVDQRLEAALNREAQRDFFEDGLGDAVLGKATSSNRSLRSLFADDDMIVGKPKNYSEDESPASSAIRNTTERSASDDFYAPQAVARTEPKYLADESDELDESDEHFESDGTGNEDIDSGEQELAHDVSDESLETESRDSEHSSETPAQHRESLQTKQSRITRTDFFADSSANSATNESSESKSAEESSEPLVAAQLNEPKKGKATEYTIKLHRPLKFARKESTPLPKAELEQTNPGSADEGNSSVSDSLSAIQSLGAQGSEPEAAVAFEVAVPADSVVASVQNQGSDGIPPDMKECPRCAELIKKKAVYCRFCHMDLPTELENPLPHAAVSPAVVPSANPFVSPAAGPSANPAVDPAVSPTVNPAKNPAVDPAVSPAKNSAVNPATSPAVNPTGSPTVNPAGQRDFFASDSSVSAETKKPDLSGAKPRPTSGETAEHLSAATPAASTTPAPRPSLPEPAADTAAMKSSAVEPSATTPPAVERSAAEPAVQHPVGVPVMDAGSRERAAVEPDEPTQDFEFFVPSSEPAEAAESTNAYVHESAPTAEGALTQSPEFESGKVSDNSPEPDNYEVIGSVPQSVQSNWQNAEPIQAKPESEQYSIENAGTAQDEEQEVAGATDASLDRRRFNELLSLFPLIASDFKMLTGFDLVLGDDFNMSLWITACGDAMQLFTAELSDEGLQDAFVFAQTLVEQYVQALSSEFGLEFSRTNEIVVRQLEYEEDGSLKSGEKLRARFPRIDELKALHRAIECSWPATYQMEDQFPMRVVFIGETLVKDEDVGVRIKFFEDGRPVLFLSSTLCGRGCPTDLDESSDGHESWQASIMRELAWKTAVDCNKFPLNPDEYESLGWISVGDGFFALKTRDGRLYLPYGAAESEEQAWALCDANGEPMDLEGNPVSQPSDLVFISDAELARVADHKPAGDHFDTVEDYVVDGLRCFRQGTKWRTHLGKVNPVLYQLVKAVDQLCINRCYSPLKSFTGMLRSASGALVENNIANQKEVAKFESSFTVKK